jgi:gamma-glutamylputrescine oxidase
VTALSIWDEPDRKPNSPLKGEISADVCVVGLGGAGLSALSELAARGVEAVGVDAGVIGGGAAGRNAGFLLGGLADFFDENVARWGGEIASALYRHTLDEITRMATEYPADVTLTGSLRIAATSDELRNCEEHLQALRAHGFAADRYSGAEGTGLLLPTDGVYHPQRCLHAAAAKIRQVGVRLFEHTPVLGLAPGEVRTCDGTVRCANIIIAVDGRLECLLPELGPRVRTARLQMLATAPVRDVSFPRPVYCRHGYEYWQQLPTGEIALGGFRDRGGEVEWTTEAAPSDVVQTLLEQFLRARLGTTAPITHRWAACVAYTPDRLPILEEVRSRVFAVGAYSGTGNVASRLSGRAAAQLACGVKSDWAGLLRAARRTVTPASQPPARNSAFAASSPRS